MKQQHCSIKTLKRIAALFAACCVCTETLSGVSDCKPAGVNAGNDKALMIDQTRTLSYAGDRSYTMTLDASAYLSKEFFPENMRYSADGYFEAPYDGKYLVQLWGGDGGDGASAGFTSELKQQTSFPYLWDVVYSPIPGGTGGKGGYVWSIMTLEAGDVLLYNIGTKGSSTVRTDEGGGINGDGGAHGEDGQCTVGGGGGYSAVYYYKQGEYNGELRPSEADRTSKFVMIAGGGGGGGASQALGVDMVGSPNGGDAGSMDSLSGSVDGGIYYAGKDGTSSGYNTDYIGQGGTYKPGAAVMPNGVIDAASSEGGNDWYCITNANAEGGHGGAGNLRGGGGGAGYCGGSGGAMQGPVLDYDIGGGGGGSSFIRVADYMTNDENTLSADEKTVLGKSKETNKNVDKGGYCNIAYLSTTQTDYSPYSSVNITIPVSPYFTASAENGTWDDNSNTLTFSGLNIAPDDLGKKKNTATVTVTFTAKENFAGGNHVPLLSGAISMSPENLQLPSYEPKEELDYVNVPLAYSLTTQSIWHDAFTEADAPITDEELYETNISDLTNIDFIDAVTDITVTPDDDRKPANTQKYNVSYIVVPNTDVYASVGPQQIQKEYSGVSVVNIRKPGETMLPSEENSEVTIKTKRTLEYVDDAYKTKIEISATTKAIPYQWAEAEKPKTAEETASVLAGKNDFLTVTGTYTAPLDGWYLVELWGGNGGLSQKVTHKNNTGNPAGDTNGKPGGIGGYIYCYIKLNANEKLDYQAGGNGIFKEAESGGLRGSPHAGEGGNGGSYSSISQNDVVLMAAAGGGGAGGCSARYNADNENIIGTAGKSATRDNTHQNSNHQEYVHISGLKYEWQTKFMPNKANGSGGSDAGGYNAGNGGDAGSNWFNEEIQSQGKITQNADVPAADGFDIGEPNDDGFTTCGKVRITPLDTSPKATKEAEGLLSSENLKLTLNGELAQYFQSQDSAFGDFNFDSLISTADNTTDHTCTASASYVIEMNAKPIDGFLGGNDVPLFKEGGLTLTCTYNGTAGKSVVLPNGDALNYANVAIPTPEFLAQDVKKVYGTATDLPSDIIDVSYSFTSDTDQSAFVKFTAPSVGEDPNTPNATITKIYDLTAILAPTTAAEKATVIPPVSAKEYAQQATMTVVYGLTTDFTDISCDAPETFPMGEDFSTVLVPTLGYELPSSITVQCGNATLSSLTGYRYNQETGEVFVPKENINGNLTITAAAVVPTYDLVFRYATNAGNTKLVTKKFSYPAGTTFDENSSWRTDFYDNFEPMNIPGMSFKWNWGDSGEEELSEMPSMNWTVNGVYSLNSHTLTVHYVDSNNETKNVSEDYQQVFFYGEKYSVTSPAVQYYMPETEKAVVSGTMGDEDIEVYVKYEQIQGKLVIVYVDEDGNIVDKKEETLGAGSSFNIASPAVTGYTADMTSVSGTMPENEGVYKIVTYHPNAYSLTLNANGGRVSEVGTRTAYYGKAFGYCGIGDDGKYIFKALPTPVKEGSTFKGWQTIMGGEQVMVSSDTICKLTADATLTAIWDADKVTLKISYLFENGDEAAEVDLYTETPEDWTEKYAAGFPLKDTAETVRTTEVVNGEHYHTECDETVTMGFLDKAVTVKFIGNPYTLTVKYKDVNGNEIATAMETHQVKYGTDYSFAAKKPEEVDESYTNQYAAPETVEGTMSGDTEVWVQFVKNDTVISVTVEWSSLVFDAQNAIWDPDRHIYYADAFKNQESEEAYGTITITNNSDPNTPIRAELSYDARFGYDDISAGYSVESDAVNSVVVESQEGENTKEIHVTPQGELVFTEAGVYDVGTCKVQLSVGS